MKLKEYAAALFDLVLPRTCAVCGKPLAMEERQICSDCLADVPYTYHWLLEHNEMADRFNGLILDHSSRYEYAVSLFFYRKGSPYRNITRALKYHGNRELGTLAARKLGENIASCPWLKDIDLIIPVPLHWTRHWQRGYNQAEVIAEGIAQEVSAPLESRTLRRCRRTRSQTHLSLSDKRKNVHGAFSIKGEAPSAHHILLVDDVFTTGSTLSECYKALRSAYPESTRISIATLGFVGDL